MKESGVPGEKIYAPFIQKLILDSKRMETKHNEKKM